MGGRPLGAGSAWAHRPAPVRSLKPPPPAPRVPNARRKPEGHLGTQASSCLSSGLHRSPGSPTPGARRGYLGAAPTRVLQSPVPAGGAATLSGSSRPPRPPDPKRNPARRAPPPAARLVRRPVPRPPPPETYPSAAGAGWARTEAPGPNTARAGAARAGPGWTRRRGRAGGAGRAAVQAWRRLQLFTNMWNLVTQPLPGHSRNPLFLFPAEAMFRARTLNPVHP